MTQTLNNPPTEETDLHVIKPFGDYFAVTIKNKINRDFLPNTDIRIDKTFEASCIIDGDNKSMTREESRSVSDLTHALGLLYKSFVHVIKCYHMDYDFYEPDLTLIPNEKITLKIQMKKRAVKDDDEMDS